MNSDAQLLIFAIVAMAGLIGIFTVETFTIAEQAEAADCKAGLHTHYDPSKGRCFHP